MKPNGNVNYTQLYYAYLMDKLLIDFEDAIDIEHLSLEGFIKQIEGKNVK